MKTMAKFQFGVLSLMLVISLVMAGCSKEQQVATPSSPALEALPDLESKGSPDMDARAMAASCGGYSSSGNPYPCCSYNGSATAGNCTWWAWKQARDVWGLSLPGWSHAKTWASYARNAGYPVNTTPAINTIGVNTSGTYGHVAWVTAVNSNGTVTVSEMMCGYFHGMRSKTYATSYFNGGYIYHKLPYFSPTPTLGSYVVSGQRIYFTGTAWDDVGLAKITMLVSGPRGSNLQAFTETMNVKSKSLSGYYFDSNNSTYARMCGTYYVTLWIKDTLGQAVPSTTFKVIVR